MGQFGQVRDLVVLDSLGSHLAGNTYIRFKLEASALAALASLKEKLFNGKALSASLIQVGDLNQLLCRQFMEGSCKRGVYCAFPHARLLTQKSEHELVGGLFSWRRFQKRHKLRTSEAKLEERLRQLSLE